MYLKTIDRIVWWIPFKKLRNKIRYNLIDILYNYYRQEKFLISEINSYDLQQNVFKVNIERVEIEIHSYCNRKCWFCPNHMIDRNSKLIEMDENIYLNLLEDLKKIDYSGLIYFHRYNEPLANKEILFKRIEQANKYIPNSRICIFTNSDYINKEYLQKLYEYGIDKIVMSYYLKNDNKNFDIDEIKVDMENKIEKLNLYVKNIQLDGDSLIYDLSYKNMNIVYKAENFLKSCSTRGGVINNNDNKRNEIICYTPSLSINIDYNGLVMSCCHLRSDIQEHYSMILGDLNKDNIFSIYTNKKSASIRKYLQTLSIKEKPCDTCTSSYRS